MEPYRDSLDHLFDELRWLDLLLAHQLETWFDDHGGVLDEFSGLYISDEEVLRALDRSADVRRDEETSERVVAHRRDVRRRVEATLDAGVELRLVRLRETFGLDAPASDALVVALAPELDSRYETLFAYLQDDLTKRRSTVSLVLALLGSEERDRLAIRETFARTAPLVRYGLVSLAGRASDYPLGSRTVVPDERVVEFLLGSESLDRRIEDVCAVQVPDGVEKRGATDGEDGVRNRPSGPRRRRHNGRDGSHRLGPDAPGLDSCLDDAEAVSETLSRLTATSARSVPYLVGPDGAIRRAAATAVSRERDVPLLTVDAAAIQDAERPLGEVLVHVDREARLRRALVHVASADELSTKDRARVVARLASLPEPVVLSGATALSPSDGRGSTPPVVPVELPALGLQGRRRLWRRYLGRVPTTPDVDAETMATTFRLSADQIRDAVAVAAAARDGDPLTPSDLFRACKARSSDGLADLAQVVEPTYSWADLVLSDEKLARLREIAAQLRNRGTVYGDWGFETRFGLGNGTVVLFSGPSGTGKTMTTEIIANELGLDLYRVDLAGVVSKYIGETEKNLSRIFDEAERGNVVLLFDEADALFSKRSEVSDAHDRYANVETSYLLQRIEAYDGVVFLTTNFKRNIDEAFLRRIHHSVTFPKPDQEARAEIWRRIFPEETPLGDVDTDFLAGFGLTGGNIKNIALTAAFLAADEGTSVEMSHLVPAAQREFEKSGKLVDPETFGAYRELLP